MYDLVWSKPMTKVAAEFGISDVALKKTCDRHRVPTPPRGYWAKKDAGKPVKQVRFVEAAEPQDEVIVIYRSNQQQLPETLRAIIEKDRAARAVRPKSLNSTLPKARALGEIHKSVVATAKALRAAKPDKNTAVSAIGDGLCGVEIGSASVDRVIGILDNLARSLENRGLVLVANGKSMSIAADGGTVVFKLIEKVIREKHIPNH